MDAGAGIVDATLYSYGAGAGNTTEVLAAALDRTGLNSGLNVFKLLDVAEFVLGAIQQFQPYPDRDSVTIGYAGVSSTFLLHARRIGQTLGTDPREIQLELGRHQTVAGQEHWIMRVALELRGAQTMGAG